MWVVMLQNENEPAHLYHGFHDEQQAREWADNAKAAFHADAVQVFWSMDHQLV